VKVLAVLLFCSAIGALLWLMFRDPPEDRWDGTDMGDGGFGGS
jgi:hypothetical protein